MKDYIYSDYYRVYGSYKRRLSHRLFPFIMTPQLRHLILYRKWHKARYKWLKRIIKVRIWQLKSKSQLDFPLETQIEPGLIIYHTGRVVVNGNTKIGRNVTLSPGVTIGKSICHKSHKELHPIIGDRVFIGANATIIGGVIIGDNVLIAANTFVTRNIPSNSLVIGNPAVIKPRKDPVYGYIKNAV